MLAVQPELGTYAVAKKSQTSEPILDQAWQAVLERDRRYDGMFVPSDRRVCIVGRRVRRAGRDRSRWNSSRPRSRRRARDIGRASGVARRKTELPSYRT